MEFLDMVFPVSGVETNVLVPPLVALAISFLTSMGGVSGAFLILPFQMSVLGYTAPSVSATNFVYNIAAIPSGVYRFIREGRMNWPLAGVVIIGTLPGLIVGYYIRVLYLPDPVRFKVFVGLVLLYVSVKMLHDGLRKKAGGGAAPKNISIRLASLTAGMVRYEYGGVTYGFRTLPMLLLALVVGVIGGVYGIGGGAIIAPFCVAVFGLPVHTVAGATLLATFVSSIAGVTFYSVAPSTIATSPDWPLGLLFGVGGFAGMYLGARAQKHVPQRFIKILIGAIIAALALKYILRI